MEFKDTKDVKSKEDIERITLDYSKKEEKENIENSMGDSYEDEKINDSNNIEESNENQNIQEVILMSDDNSEISEHKTDLVEKLTFNNDSKKNTPIPKITKEIKIVLLGGNKVGKTSIINRLISNSFKIESDNTFEAGPYFTAIDLDDEKTSIKFSLWDTPNKEIYENIEKDFYNNVQVIVFVYDINNKETYDEIKNYWILEAEQYSSAETCKLYYINFLNL